MTAAPVSWVNGQLGRGQGLYRALDRDGPATSAELAGRTGTAERYIRDWLEHHAVRAGKFPVIDGGTGIWSFCEITDAAAATAAVVTRGAPGIYNIVDDEPAPAAEWVPFLARCLGAEARRRYPPRPACSWPVSSS
jgi:nucleoside-diphosphate-sugar epimerase